MIALFDRAEARDFADVHELAQRFGKDLLLERAAEVDAGFDLQVFAEMLRTLSRFIDADVPVDDVGKVRQFFASWVDELKMR